MSLSLSFPLPTPEVTPLLGVLVVSADWYLLVRFHVPTCKESGPNSERRLSSTRTHPPVDTDPGSPLQQCGGKGQLSPIDPRCLPTWRDPDVGGNAESACPPGQQDSLVTGLKNDCHTQIHTSICEQLGPGDPRLLGQSSKRAERRSLTRGDGPG